MTLDQAIEFIRAKLELIAENTYREEDEEEIRRFARQAERMDDDWRLTIGQLREYDRDLLELLLRHKVLPDDQADVRKQLVARFGVSRLGGSDKAVARRVLKRGEIKTVEEYYQVAEFVSCVDNIEVIGEENYAILDSILGTFKEPDDELLVRPTRRPGPKTSSSRRREPPPFDLLLEADEKLRPSDTPLATLREFVRTKFQLVAEHARYPEEREMLHQTLEAGLQLASQLKRGEEDEARRLEFTEHEAEAFSGQFVSGAQHRAIEAELEKRFGFRRIGPSAQARVARMIGSNTPVRNHQEKIIVERFIRGYPHQTLFTAAQIKQVVALLKHPPLDQPKPPPSRIHPKTPPDLSRLCVGAVFQPIRGGNPYRVIAFDEALVFYDTYGGETLGWTFGDHKRMAVYYRMPTWLFLEETQWVRIDEPTSKQLALHRPDLPLRFARSQRLQWQETPLPTRAAFEAYIRENEPTSLAAAPIKAPALVLIPISSKGALKRSVIVSAENGAELSLLEILWCAHQHQGLLPKAEQPGVGLFRAGLGKGGVPSYSISGYHGPRSDFEPRDD